MAKIDNREWFDSVVRNRRRMDQLHEQLETPVQRRLRGWWPFFMYGLLGLAIIVMLLIMVA